MRNYVRLIYTFFSSVSADQSRQNHLVWEKVERRERRRENKGENGIWLESGGREKMVGLMTFLPKTTILEKIIFSPNLEEK